MKKVFLSHSSRDKPFVRDLANSLISDGYNVWLDEAEIKIGDSLIDKLSDALDSMDYFVITLSKNSVNSKWVQEELKVALTREFKERKIIVLPIKIEDVDMPTFLLDKLYGDFSDFKKIKSNYDLLKKSMI